MKIVIHLNWMREEASSFRFMGLAVVLVSIEFVISSTSTYLALEKRETHPWKAIIS